jgi:hypothetical protein
MQTGKIPRKPQASKRKTSTTVKLNSIYRFGPIKIFIRTESNTPHPKQEYHKSIEMQPSHVLPHICMIEKTRQQQRFFCSPEHHCCTVKDIVESFFSKIRKTMCHMTSNKLKICACACKARKSGLCIKTERVKSNQTKTIQLYKLK